MASEILQYKTENGDVLLTIIQWRIVKMLEKHPNGLTRGHYDEKGSLTRLLNKKRTTIYDNLIKLERKGIVKRYTINDGTEGRPKVYWKLTNGGINDGE